MTLETMYARVYMRKWSCKPADVFSLSAMLFLITAKQPSKSVTKDEIVPFNTV